MGKDKITFETFREIGSWEIGQMTAKEPSCFNGMVRVKKYKITIEEIEEPKDVLTERLQKLWDECDNHHHWSALRITASRLGYELKGKPGNRREQITI